ncbi:MAG: AAA family ATPase [Gammaproteobacteria bacterium]|nr:AAA family ATPase [Gammaproteobacteria bacterium]
MITKFTIGNFKRIKSAELELGDAVVFIGPNNSGKTTALQALALWDVGWRRWAEKRDRSTPGKRPGVTINRRDLYSIPVPSARLLWKDLHTQDTSKQRAEKTYIVLTAEGIHDDKPWVCALEFYYANEESFYCRLRDSADGVIPEGARHHSVVYLPPMSGLAEREYRKEQGEIKVLIGEGQTAQVLRNLCWQLFSMEDKRAWRQLVDHIDDLFHIRLDEPKYIKERSELSLTYRERSGIELDLSSSGRGCQQVLLLLSFLFANPGSVLLLDEPDAHLEILRQRDVYNLITQVASANGSQIIAASHSGTVLQEAAERDVVMAFVGTPHRIDTRSGGSQLRKALESIRMADYYLAEQKGWMLYLEGSTDLAILRRLAERLDHPAGPRCTIRYPPFIWAATSRRKRDHFHGLREANPPAGFALFDRLERELHTGSLLTERMWRRREIENYLVTPASLRAFVVQDLPSDDLIGQVERAHRLETLDTCLAQLLDALRITTRHDPWGPDIKVTDEFLDPLFKLYYERLGTPQQLFKRDYHGLADAIPVEEIDPEVTSVLDAIAAVAGNAKPVT